VDGLVGQHADATRDPQQLPYHQHHGETLPAVALAGRLLVRGGVHCIGVPVILTDDPSI
jgi:hypothetical protein